MKNNNYDDFLLDPSHDDLDSLHNEAERQLLRPGGFLNKLRKKVKTKLTDKRNKKNSSKKVSNAQAAEINNVGNSNPKGSKSTTAKTAPVKKATPVKKRVDTSATDPKINVKRKPLVVKKTNAPLKTKRGTGKSYKMAWDGMSAAKKAKYKGGYSEFETAAKDYNKTKDAKNRADAGTKAHEERSEKFKKKLITDTNRAKVIKGFNSSTEERMTKERTEKRLNSYGPQAAADARRYGEEKAYDMQENMRESTGVRSNDGPTAEWFHSKKPFTKKMDKIYNKQFTGTISAADKKKNSEIKAAKKQKAKQAVKKRSGGLKPDYLDMDKDGNKKESMKGAIKQKKKLKRGGMKRMKY